MNTQDFVSKSRAYREITKPSLSGKFYLGSRFDPDNYMGKLVVSPSSSQELVNIDFRGLDQCKRGTTFNAERLGRLIDFLTEIKESIR